MSLDRLCPLFIISILPLLWLPQEFLWLGYLLAVLLALIGFIKQQKSLITVALLIGLSYFQVIAIAEKAGGVTAKRHDEIIQIVQILKQQVYQTAIAQRQNSERIYLNWQAKTPLQLERFYHATFNLRPISSRQNIGNFDRQKWYFAQHIQAIANVKQAKLLPEQSLSLRTKWLDRVQQQTAELRTQGLLLALAFGERAWLQASDWKLFQQTATAHLIAISGLHIALAMGFGIVFGKGILWFAGRFDRVQRVKISPFFAKMIGFAVAVGYSYLAGFAVPTVRALLAISLILLCQVFRRHYTPWQFWWRVVALLLLVDPFALLSDSFWLSVLAVVSLILWYQHFPLRKWLPDICKKYPKFTPLLSLVHLQIGIWLVFSPVQLLFFEGISPFALLSNLVVVPLYSLLLVPLILFSLLTDNLLNSWWLADQLAQGSLWFLQQFSPYWLDLSYTEQWQLLAVNLLILLLISAIQHKSKLLWQIAVIVPLGCYFLPTLWLAFVPQPLARWVIFDVGQGLATAFIYRENGKSRAVIYDTGASWQDGSMAELEILPYLKQQGIDVKGIVISHDDNDHSGGLPSLLRQFPTSHLISSGQNHLNHSFFEFCEKGKKWQFGQLTLSAIFPEQAVKRAKNANSCVLLVEIGKFRVLLTGDVGSEQERQFVDLLGKVDILQVGHHGSNTSTSHTLLAHIQPKVAVISAGRWNPWQLPNRLVEKRLAQYQVENWNTAKAGMVQIDFFPEKYQIRTARERFSPWYRSYLGSP